MSQLPSLPAEYELFLAGNNAECSYEHDDVEWELAQREELLKPVNIDGQSLPYINMLQGYVESIREYFHNEATADLDGNSIPLDRVAGGLAIGTGNGDVLYLDPAEDFSVWCFRHDGGDVVRLTDSFAHWLQEAELVDDEDFQDEDDFDDEEE